MTTETYNLEIITPCFCAGADQSKAEIRAPSIRGQLRWWFRVLGGTAKEEGAIFGTVAGDEVSTSSALMVRVGNFQSGPAWHPPTINQNTPVNYVWHFASVSGTTARGKTGPRWISAGAVPPRSTFTFHLTWRRPITATQKALFDQALHAFLAMGTLGLRATRGLGAFVCKQAESIEKQRPMLEKAGIVIRQRTDPDTFNSYESALRDYSAWFRYDFRKKWKADLPSPLGTSSPRQTSALRFRPIKLASGQFTWLAYEAPHSRVLGLQTRTSKPMLDNYTFSGAAPIPPEKPRRY